MSKLNCNIKKFTNITRFTGKGKWLSSETVGNLKKTTYEAIDCNDFFEITCLTFNSKEECISNKNTIEKIFNDRLRSYYERVSHFSSDNIHIIFYAYSEDYGGNLYSRKGHGKDVRRAAKTLKLK